MSKFIDLTGQVLGRLTVIGLSHKDKHGRWRWDCKCECGSSCIISGDSLRKKDGPTRSCGCLRIDSITTHGCSRKDISNIYYGIMHRCGNPESKDYPRYGGRGIVVCEEWKKDIRSFVTWGECNGYRKGLTIDRIDNDGNYCPENCRWVLPASQSRNRSNNKLITYKGETKILEEWGEYLGIDADRICHRLSYGWDIERAFTEPSYSNRVYTTEDGIANTFNGWAEVTGMPVATIRARVKRHGWSIDRAISEPIHNNGRKKPL